MSIQLFTPTYRVDECLKEIKDCLEIGWTGIGYKTDEFEKEWKNYTGLPYAHFLNSATAGLHLAVKLLKLKYDWQEGDEIISTPITFVSTNHAILHEGLKPVFADVDEYLCLDPKDIEKKITSKTRAVMFVGMGGSTGKYEEIVEICAKHNLSLIIDAAHMAGTRLNGIIPGREADAVVYSFQAVKNLPTADSGMVCFADAELDDMCRKYSWLGINKNTYSRMRNGGNYKWKYDVDYVGYKYHSNSIMAAMGLVGIKYLDNDNESRQKLAARYSKNFNAHSNRIQLIPAPKGCVSSTHLYIIKVHNRDELLNVLNENGIYPGVHYRDNTEYSMYSYAKGTCPNAAKASEMILSLPLSLRMTDKEVDFISNIVIEYEGSLS